MTSRRDLADDAGQEGSQGSTDGHKGRQIIPNQKPGISTEHGICKKVFIPALQEAMTNLRPTNKPNPRQLINALGASWISIIDIYTAICRSRDNIHPRISIGAHDSCPEI